MDEKGQSWPEAMLSLVIILVIFSSLLPMATKLTSSVLIKKNAMIAAETSFQAAIHFRANGQLSGSRTHEGRDYHWTVSGGEICVTYEEVRGLGSKCVNL
ncbi:hypothetical protein ABZ756_01200 [Mammaliicoccus sciuri]|uniref:Competence protein ComGE n=2 Tax=Sporosarcina newyorkensis TaxID=759851 RepID=A0A1T4XG02_9BACL|nr:MULTISPECIES: hypothetical protein [Sporosarcina]EGQ27785.1 hypothetical protein HMPREF9372_0265 [Sporosarcina newyorkensis 2681]MBY0220903.1 hypothetical protein [Sporosarcina aquimarina]SKA88512.1 hypothetical protein SAMN04244570_0686 [Sporosarcina newyorkensis]